MKKQKIKLGLTKSSISNLSNLQNIRGGNGTYSVEYFCIESFTVALEQCCGTVGTGGGGTGGTTGGTLCGNTLELNCGYNTYEVYSCEETGCCPG
jgi:hypothetical protein